jgi:hypothetical protein
MMPVGSEHRCGRSPPGVLDWFVSFVHARMSAGGGCLAQETHMVMGFSLTALVRASFPVLLLANLLLSRQVYARNIFDDDWTPPTSRPAIRSTPLPPAVTTQPLMPPALVPQAGAQPIPLAIAVPPTPKVRRPIPEKSAQAKSRKLFKEVFSKELADRSPAARCSRGSVCPARRR